MQHHAVHLFADDQLAAQSTVVTTLEGVLEHVVFHALCGLYFAQPGFVDIGVASGATAGAAAVGGNARHRGKGSGLHDRLADVAFDLMGGAVVFDKRQCGHVLLRYCWRGSGMTGQRLRVEARDSAKSQ
ncbi:hypothetical protein D3C86_1762550 [compost metagenome]